MKISKLLLKSIRSFEGIIKLAKTTTLQTVIVKKGAGMTLAKARTVANGFGKSSDVDETADSWRFRQREPSAFIKGSFVTKAVDENVSIVLGKLK